MAESADVKFAVGCMSSVFPLFVAKEMAMLTDQVASAILGFTDPLSALGDINLDSLVDDVASLSEGDVFSNLGQAAVGLTAQYVLREQADMLEAMASEFASVTKRMQSIRNLSSRILSSASLLFSLLTELPYIAAQKMCRTIVDLTELKTANLSCLQKHIVQLVNCIMVMIQNARDFADETFADLDAAALKLIEVKTELARSQRFQGGRIVFDSNAFERARNALFEVSQLLTPDQDGTSILDVVDILTFGSVDAAHASRANLALTRLVIPSLIALIDSEVAAVFSQTEVINQFIAAIRQTVPSFRDSQKASRVVEMRARLIRAIQERLDELAARIDQARARRSLRVASAEMLLWSSRVKSIMAMMDRVKELTLEEGSSEGPDQAALLAEAFQTLLDELAAIDNDATTDGIEDPTQLRNRVLALTAGAGRLVDDISQGRTNPNRLATFHALAAQTATAQMSAIVESQDVAGRQKVACEKFAAIEIGASEQFDQLLNGMRMLGLDRAVDLLSLGQFSEFLSADLDSLSYLGVVINCLTKAITGIDDISTRRQIADIRDSLLGRQINELIAAIDSADAGRLRLLTKLKEQISSIQKNAKTVESIVEELKNVATQIGANLSDAAEGFSDFMMNIDHLAVGAGGRLAADLEEFAKHPNTGVVQCDL